MAAVMTITITFDDANSLTTNNSHEITSEVANRIIKMLKRRSEVTNVLPTYSAADTLGITVN